MHTQTGLTLILKKFINKRKNVVIATNERYEREIYEHNLDNNRLAKNLIRSVCLEK